MRPAAFALLLCLTQLTTGCDLLGIEGASALTARRDAEGKAVGGACRHAGRAIEDCYVQNKKADKAAVFAGWREMNDYMRDNKIESVSPEPDVAGEAATELAATPAAKPPNKAAAEPKKAS